MSKKRTGLAFILLLILMTLLFIRNFRDPAGLTATGADVVTQFIIMNNLEKGPLFPELHRDRVSEHSVSKYLPVYHGLLFFHISAMALESVGLSLPGAMQLLLELSFLIVVLTFLLELKGAKQTWRDPGPWLAILFFVLLFPTGFSRASHNAFFSQIYSTALLCLAWLCRNKDWKKTSLLFLFLASWTYPDFLVWLLPLAMMGPSPTLLQKAFRVTVGLVWAGLMWALFKRMHLPGPTGFDLFPFVLLLIFVGAFHKEIRAQNRALALAMLSFCVICGFFLVQAPDHFNFKYYAIKMTAPALLFLVYLFLKIDLTQKRMGLVLIVFVLFMLPAYGEISWKESLQFWKGPVGISNQFYMEADQFTHQVIEHAAQKGCRKEATVIHPLLDDPKDYSTFFRTGFLNTFLQNADVTDLNARSPDFRVAYTGRPQSLFTDFQYGAELTWEDFLLLIGRVKRTEPVCVVIDQKLSEKVPKNLDSTSQFENRILIQVPIDWKQSEKN